MKKVTVPIQDLIDTLEQFRDVVGTTHIIVGVKNGLPFLADATEEENMIMFQPLEETEQEQIGVEEFIQSVEDEVDVEFDSLFKNGTNEDDEGLH